MTPVALLRRDRSLFGGARCARIPLSGHVRRDRHVSRVAAERWGRRARRRGGGRDAQNDRARDAKWRETIGRLASRTNPKNNIALSGIFFFRVENI